MESEYLIKKGCRIPKSANDELFTKALLSSNRGRKTFWNAFELTTELRTEERRETVLDNRDSKPICELSI